MKRIFSIALSIVLALTIIPFYAGAESSSEIKVGDSIEFGSYYQTSDGSGGFNKEPIKWNVLKVENGKALLLSSKIIDAARYNNTSATVNGYYGNNYAHSEVRKWLIDDFYNSAFTENEKNCILETTLDNSACATDYNASGSYNKYSSESTTDKVFLLSKNEIDTLASKYMNKSVTDYAKSRGFQQIVSTEACNAWLTRTAGNNTFQIYYVQIRWGKWTTYYNWNDDKITVKMGACPAIWVDMEKINQSKEEQEKGSYIGYLALGYSSKSLKSAQAVLTNQGYKATGIDLNEGTGGRYICCGWMNVSTAKEAIRDIRVYIGSDAPDTFLLNGCTYEKVGADSTSICYPGKNGDGAFDLNFKADGDYLYLYATRDPKAGAPIRQIDFSFEPVKTEWNTVEYHNSDMPELADFNKGTGGDAVYMHYYSTDPKSGYGTPDWYNFDRDSFDFFNYGTEIDKEYFYNMFGKARGYCLWMQKHYQSGVCFGMAYTTAAILNGYPKSSNMRTDFSSTESPIKIGLKEMTINDYIKYAHIYQFGWTFALCSTWSEAKTIRSMVEKTLKNNNIEVTIGFKRTDKNEAHRVLAVGIGDNGDILIDDPNGTYGLERLQINENGDWTYTGLPGWNKDNCKLRYSSDCIMPYNYLMMSIGLDFSNVLTASESQADDDKLLLTVEDENCSINTSDIIEIISENGNGDNSESSKQYWLMSDKSVTVKNLNQEKNEFSLADENYVLSAEVFDNSTVSIELDDKKAETKIASVSGNKYTVSSIQFDEENRPVELKISGTASGNTVTALKTENGMTVNGLNDIKVIYSVDETEVSDKKADVKDGREVNITVDDKNETVDTDFVPDSAKCKFCGKVHGDSFIELFVKFFHKIFYLISKLFK